MKVIAVSKIANGYVVTRERAPLDSARHISSLSELPQVVEDFLKDAEDKDEKEKRDQLADVLDLAGNEV